MAQTPDMAKTIVVIAPVTPFRGGIARHSTALARALGQLPETKVHVESFARLYPEWLYPGESSRDADAAAPAGLAVTYGLDTLNPLTWRAAARRIAALGPALVVIPAWTFFVAPMLGWLARALRRRGIRVAQVVHNVADHDGAGWKRRLSHWQLAAADGYLTHGEALADALRTIAGGRPIAVHPHPVYADYPRPAGTLPRTRGLELLCFGLVRPYKGVDIAIRALAASGLADVRLTVAGESWLDPDPLPALAHSLGVADRVEFISRYVGDAEAAELFARADAVLAPYRHVTGSGVVALARHYHRPVIASDLAGLREHVEHGGTGWLFPAEDEAALAKLIAGDITRNAAARMAQTLENAPINDGWSTLATALAAFTAGHIRKS